jgi:hypothetical protein
MLFKICLPPKHLIKQIKNKNSPETDQDLNKICILIRSHYKLILYNSMLFEDRFHIKLYRYNGIIIR